MHALVTAQNVGNKWRIDHNNMAKTMAVTWQECMHACMPLWLQNDGNSLAGIRLQSACVQVAALPMLWAALPM